MEIIGLSGFARSGKDTAGRHLTENRGFTRYAFADRMREVLLELDLRISGTVSVRTLLEQCEGSWSRALNHRVHGPELRRSLEAFGKTVCTDTFNDAGRSDEDIRDDVWTLDPFLDGEHTMGALLAELDGDWDAAKTHRLYGPEVRRLMQIFATEVVRENYGGTAWVDVVAARVASEKPAAAVITDVRFPEEAAWLQGVGATILSIQRPGVGPVNGHRSELGLAPAFVSATVHNDSTLEVLAARVDAARSAATPAGAQAA